MDNIAGAERVGLTLARDLNADLYSTIVDKDAIKKMGFDIRVKKIGWIPINAPIRQQMALWRFRKLNLQSEYDYFIIDGDWAVSGAVNNKPNLWYVHSPIREIWDLYHYTRKNIVKSKLTPIVAKHLFDAWVYLNRYLNKKYVKHVEKIVCNSINTQKRVKKYLKRDSLVINPPIETSQYHFKKTGYYWLSVNRLITHKRVDLQIKAFKKMPNEKLIVVGCYEEAKHFREYANYINSIRPKNVTLLYRVPFNKLVELYANCKGFITTSKEEDFGMTIVEAMASGKPVIAPNEGGYKESVVKGTTGELIDDINEYKLVKTIKEVGKKPESYKRECIKHAKKFDTKIFIRKIKKVLNYQP